ncbi:MAG: BON domain-containing protein [Gammaproteobacteria bacterium]
MPSGGGTAGTSGGRANAAGKPVSQSVVDSSISTAVRSRFGAHSTLKAFKIVVDTHDGIVTLQGRVNTVADKSAAQAEARAVSGVKGVNNQLTVR